VIKRILIVVVCILVVSAGLAGLFLFTEKGLQTSVALIPWVSGNRVQIGKSQGKLLGGWQLFDISIESDTVDIKISRFSCNWLPDSLFKARFHAAEISLKDVGVIVQEQSAGAVSAEAFIPPEVTLPLSFLIGRLDIERVNVRQQGQEELFTIDAFSAQLSGSGNRLEFADVQLRSPYLSGSADGHVTMSGDWPVHIQSQWQTEVAEVAGCQQFQGSAQVSETLTDPVIELHLSEPEVLTVKGSLADLFGDISYRVHINCSALALSNICNQWPVAVVDLDLKAEGDLNNAKGTAQSTLLVDEFLPVTAEVDFSVDKQKLTIADGSLGYGENQVKLSGGLDFTREMSWNTIITAQSFAVSELLPPLPQTLSDARLDVHGKWVEDGLIYSANIEDVEITVSEYDLQIGGGLTVTGDLGGLEITTSAFDCGDGQIEIDGLLSWADQFQWQGDVRLDSFDPSIIDSLPEGSVRGNFTSRGQIGASDLFLETEIKSLSGELSGYQLSGGGNLIYQDQVLTVTDLNITNGDNKLFAEGTVAEQFDLDFRVNGAELERIYPLLSGKLEITGELSGPRSEPVVQVHVDGSGLSFQDYSAGKVAGEALVTIAERDIKGTVRLEEPAAAGFFADRIDLSVDGSIDDHQISGDLKLDRNRIQFDASGGLLDNVWNVEIGKLVIKDNTFGQWNQSGSTRIQVAPEFAAIDRLCLTLVKNSVCVEASWNQDNSWSMSADELEFELSSLNNWGFLDQKIDGTIAASLQVNGNEMTIVSATASAALDEWEIDLGANEYYEEFKWFDSQLSFAVNEGDLTSEFSTRFVDNSSLSGAVSLPGAADLSNEITSLPLRGDLDIDIKDLSWLRVLTSDYILPKGSLAGELEIEGRPDNLAVSGQVDLHDGELRIPFLGVDLTRVTGTIEAQTDRLLLELDSVSGDGKLHSSGEFLFGNQIWQGELIFLGTNCELLNRRAIKVTADPNLDLKLGPDGGSLNGEVTVLQALIEVEKIDRSVSESSDVVFVDKQVESDSWPFDYNIDVTLGDDVKVVGLGLNGRLGGFLEVISSPDGNTAGRGFLDILDGNYTLYGSPLQITRGRLTFDGGPVDNPSLDIQATKFIKETRFGYEGVEAGVKITGSVADFEMELYSNPNMTENNILAYILLDKPFTTEGDEGTKGLVNSAAKAIGLGKGSDLITDVSSILPVDDIRVEGGIDTQETSLVVGKNLSEDLSVSYDYNLFNNAGSFRVRYEFDKGFSVESRNSIESNAVELLYSFER